MSSRAELWHKRRLRAEKRFRYYGITALASAVLILVWLMTSIVSNGLPGFLRSEIRMDITFDPALLSLKPGENAENVSASSYDALVRAALRQKFPEVTDRREQQRLYSMLGGGTGRTLKEMADANPAILSTTQSVWLLASSNADLYLKGRVSEEVPESERKLDDQQLGWLKVFKETGDSRVGFNTNFFTQGASRTPELAGFLGAMMGSLLTLIACLLVAFPLGVMTAVYLEEFAKKSRWVDLIEVNINNLAAVPSIVFGLLGLAVYINVMGMPRSASLVGGLTLAMMILPVIIIATRSAIAAVPPSMRDAARALGASPLQVVWHHVLPYAMPGIMTGTILGMARAIGETAPLLMIGMVAFIADTPMGFTDPATVMPVQIYLWASSPESGFVEKTATGILVLLVLLLAMNALAIFLRKRFEIRW